MQSVYVFKLVDDKYFVGSCKTPVKVAFDKHFWGGGGEWTRIYAPKDIVECYLTRDDPFEVDRCVIDYMKNYGVENVRGGSFSWPELNMEQLKCINETIENPIDDCVKCKMDGHLSINCPYRGPFTTGRFCTNCGMPGHNSEKCEREVDRRDRCLRCGRCGHGTIDCYAQTYMDQSYIE